MAGTNTFRRWTSFGTGIGIEILNDSLLVCIAKVRPGGVDVLGATAIENISERPASEWGAEYAEFLKVFGGRHLAATVVLPRSEVIVRELPLPGVKDADVPAAIGYQLDSLHPYPEDDVEYDWARLAVPYVAVGIARKETIARYRNLLAEGGVQVSALSISGSVMYAARRVHEDAPASDIAASITRCDVMEVYGESVAHPMFTNVFDVPGEAFEQRAAGLAFAELRLDPASAEMLSYERILPVPRKMDAGIPLNGYAVAYAAAISAAAPRRLMRVNLLPVDQRRENSKLVYVPTAILAVVALGLGVANLSYDRIEEKRYESIVRAEVAKLAPAGAKADALDRSAITVRKRIQLIDQMKQRCQLDLDSLNELTRIVAPPGWVNTMDMNRTTVTIAGEADQSAGLLKMLDESPLFMNSDFTMPLSRAEAGHGEAFRIRTMRETPRAVAAVAKTGGGGK